MCWLILGDIEFLELGALGAARFTDGKDVYRPPMIPKNKILLIVDVRSQSKATNEDTTQPTSEMQRRRSGARSARRIGAAI